jgi:uncharacterized membrane protein YeiH
VIHTIELLAVSATAVYGVLLARRHGFDVVGVVSVALIVSFGGGTLRDLFLDRHPLFWIRDSHLPMIVVGLAVGTSLIPRIPEQTERWLYLPDALGLGLFTVVGANAAIECGTSLFVASLLGVVTGTFGGVIGDVVCNRVPSLFRPSPLYATCAFAGTWCLFLFRWLQVPDETADILAVCLIVVLRLSALRWNWMLPQPGSPAAVDDSTSSGGTDDT